MGARCLSGEESLSETRAKGTWIGETENQVWEERDGQLDGAAHTSNLST